MLLTIFIHTFIILIKYWRKVNDFSKAGMMLSQRKELYFAKTEARYIYFTVNSCKSTGFPLAR